jgi:hypothetical protein
MKWIGFWRVFVVLLTNKKYEMVDPYGNSGKMEFVFQ